MLRSRGFSVAVEGGGLFNVKSLMRKRTITEHQNIPKISIKKGDVLKKNQRNSCFFFFSIGISITILFSSNGMVSAFTWKLRSAPHIGLHSWHRRSIGQYYGTHILGKTNPCVNCKCDVYLELDSHHTFPPPIYGETPMRQC